MDNVSIKEQQKYIKAWGIHNYGRWSPGFETAQTLSTRIALVPGKSITDYGAGDCKAAVVFMQKGLHVQAVDIALTAACNGTLDSYFRMFSIGLHEQSLWEMDDQVIETDYAFCADVMEHIPPKKVSKVLKAISQRTREAAVFRICHRADSEGKKIGETLHLTIQPCSWWLEQLQKYFQQVIPYTTGDDTLYVCKKG